MVNQQRVFCIFPGMSDVSQTKPAQLEPTQGWGLGQHGLSHGFRGEGIYIIYRVMHL